MRSCLALRPLSLVAFSPFPHVIGKPAGGLTRRRFFVSSLCLSLSTRKRVQDCLLANEVNVLTQVYDKRGLRAGGI